MRVEPITAGETHELRLLVLRPGGKAEDAHFVTDREEGAFHLGVRLGDRTICVGSFHREAHPDLGGTRPYRLRGMASHPDHQGQGAGGLLLRHALDHLSAQQADLLWCHARLKAVPFYLRAGLQVRGGAFELPAIGPHHLMYHRFRTAG